MAQAVYLFFIGKRSMTNDSPAPPLSVNIQVGMGAQYIKDFSFESPNVPQLLGAITAQPRMAMDVNVLSRSLGNGTFESVLKLRLETKIDDKTAFIAELAYAGLFTLPTNLPEEQTKLFLLIEAPRLLFPFARAIIANAVREGGFPHIIIQPIDFLSLYGNQQNGAPMAGTA